MYEALSAFINYGFDHLALNRIEADTDPRNERSMRLLEQLRFIKEGVFREGITKTVLPPEKHNLPLAKQLEALPEHRDLAQPLLELANAVRKGGNLGAHFDLEREPNEQVTSLMLARIFHECRTGWHFGANSIGNWAI